MPSKEVTVRSDDKPWYDTEIRKHSRKRDRLKSIALKSKRTTDWRNYMRVRNKVNNLKRHAKERFYDNLELNLTESFTNNKRDFWRLTRYFIKKNTASCSIPQLCTTDEFNIKNCTPLIRKKQTVLMTFSHPYLEYLKKTHSYQTFRK